MRGIYKVYVFTLILVLMITLGLGQQFTNAGGQEYVTKVSYSWNIRPAVKYLRNSSLVDMSIKGTNAEKVMKVYEAGVVGIPCFIVTLLLDPLSKVSISVEFSNYEKVVLKHPLIKLPPPIAILPNGEVIKGRSKVIKIGYSYHIIKWRGVRFALIKICPAQPVDSSSILIAKNVEIKAVMKSVVRPRRYISDKEILSLIASKSIDEDIVRKYMTLPSQVQNSSKGGIIILTRDIFKNNKYLREYIDLRERQGYTVKLVTVEEILNSSIKGRDIPEKIRNYISELYNESNGLYKYLLIIGDINGTIGTPKAPTSLNELEKWEVPTRYFYNPDNTWSYSFTGNYTPSDWYYVTLDTTWDSNGNGVYGEPYDGDDWAPELAVGRIPVRDNATLSKYLIDLLNYTGWESHKVLLAGSINYYFNENGEGDYGNQGDTEIEIMWFHINSSQALINMRPIRLYEHYPVITKVTSPNELNGNISITNFNITLLKYIPDIIVWSAHGFYDSAWRKVWAYDDGDGIPEEEEMEWKMFVNESIANLIHHNVSLIVAESCLTAYVDLPWDALSLAEYFINGTSLWYLGWDRVTWIGGYYWYQEVDSNYWHYSDALVYKFLDYLFNDDSPYRLDIGQSLVAAKVWLAIEASGDLNEELRKVWWASTLLGDPSQLIGTSNKLPPVTTTTSVTNTITTTITTTNTTITTSNTTTTTITHVLVGGKLEIYDEGKGVTNDDVTYALVISSVASLIIINVIRKK